MLKLARWQTREPGEVLVEEGQAKPELVFIARGAASVEKGGAIVGVCGPGDFLGEMSFLTGKPGFRDGARRQRDPLLRLRSGRAEGDDRRRIRASGRRWNTASTATWSASSSA